MRLLLLIFLPLFVSAAGAEIDPLADLVKDQPKDVAAMVERIAMCTHFAAEESYDAVRRREIAVGMTKYRCVKLVKDEATLRNRYRNNPKVLNVLRQAYEW